MRKHIIHIIASLLILLLAWTIFKKFSSAKKPKRAQKTDQLAAVSIVPVKTETVELRYETNGTTRAKNRIDIYARVQAIYKSSDRPFRAGTYFRKGERLISLDAADVRNNIKVQKAQMMQAITQMLPDLKFDYPDAYDKWARYVQDFSYDKSVRALPETSSEREKAFVTLKNIYPLYHGIKAQEVNLSYYTIRAPFNGVLTEHLVDRGSMVRQGQKLGSFINPSIYEVDLKIGTAELGRIKVGAEVSFQSPHNNKTWTGKITRVNTLIDPTTQMLDATAEVRGDGLMDGMFLNASLHTGNVENAVELPRSLVTDQSKVFVVRDSALYQKPVKVVQWDEQMAVITGLQEGEYILKRNVPGAHEGMKVKILDSK